MRTPTLYRDPALYDLLHADGTQDEVQRLISIADRHGNGGKRALEPACGTGRYLPGLLRRGWTVTGYDSSPQMVAYARRRLTPWGVRARIRPADMRTFRSVGGYDLAFNLLSSFRHLMSEREALAHLRQTHKALDPGGLYVLGLDLTVYGGEVPDEEVWTLRHRRTPITHVVSTLPASARRRRERVMNFVTLPGPKGEEVWESAYDLRSYDARELTALLQRTKFSLAACYGYDGRPAQFGGAERALWLVLKKTTPRRI